jgi:hypothetical protein
MKCRVYKIQVNFLFKSNFSFLSISIEQWKRIANRSIETSPPLSRQYFQTAAFIFDSQNGHIPDVLGSYRRPGRTESEQNTPTPPASPSILQTRRRKILLGLSILTIIIAVIVAIAVALVLSNMSNRKKEHIVFFYSSKTW